MSLLRLSLDGLPPPEARIDLEMLQDTWRTMPSVIAAQLTALLVLLYMVRDWTVPVWQWLLPTLGLVSVWAGAARLAHRFRRLDIQASNYTPWRLRLLGWHTLQGCFWGWLALVLLAVGSPEWRLTFVAAVIVYTYSVMLVAAHDWAVSVVSSVPFLLPVALWLWASTSDSANYLAVVIVLSLSTCVAVSVRISRRLREGAMLRHENAELVLQLREEIHKVTQAKARAEMADQQKSEFFASASHDLRQPLHVMMLLSGALQKHVEPQHGAPLLGKMQTALGSLSTLFERMFDVARLDAHRVDHQAVPTPLASLWARLDSEFSVLCASKGLAWRLDPTTEWVQADPHVLERILRNLLNNAARYTHQGEVRLRARVRGSAVVCQVWDTGLGVPRPLRQRIFEDYFQAHSSGRRNNDGLGLGLAVVRRLSLLGGTPVSVRSREGRGSCFSVCVPRWSDGASQASAATEIANVATTSTTQPAQATAPESAPPSGTVVLIDDEPEVLHSTALVLRQAGWKVATAASPDEALHAVATLQQEGHMPEGEMPCAVISDHRLGLPIDGLEGIAQLRYEFGEHLPALLLTAEAGPTLAEQVKAAGVALLHKPVQAATLTAWLAAQVNAVTDTDTDTA